MSWRSFYPWLNLVPQKFFAGLATLFFLGGFKAPGTWGSLAGALFVWALMSHLPLWLYGLAIFILVYAAIGICDIGERYFNLKDPGRINFDEFAAMPICYFGIFQSEALSGFCIWILAGFALFRFFDILKPLGIKRVQTIDGGLGCVLDDVLAAILVCAILNTFAFFM